jgi:hypothetical protein
VKLRYPSHAPGGALFAIHVGIEDGSGKKRAETEVNLMLISVNIAKAK